MISASKYSRRRTAGNVFGTFLVNLLKWTAMLALVGLATACVTPAPPGDVVDVAVGDYKEGTAETGVPVRWGGTIASITNKPDVTIIEIVSRPLLRSGRPRHNDSTDGRFLAEVSGFVDPEIVKQGRDISVIGTVNRMQNGKVGEADYEYPVISVFKYQFWKEITEPSRPYGYPPYMMDDRYWHDWPYRRRALIHGAWDH